MLALALTLAAGLTMPGAGLAGEDALVLPPDPVAPASDRACLALYAQYRVLIDELMGRAEACNAARPKYVQKRYGHHLGEGECARYTILHCRPWVEQCTAASQAALPALERCRARVRR